MEDKTLHNLWSHLSFAFLRYKKDAKEVEATPFFFYVFTCLNSAGLYVLFGDHSFSTITASFREYFHLPAFGNFPKYLPDVQYELDVSIVSDKCMYAQACSEEGESRKVARSEEDDTGEDVCPSQQSHAQHEKKYFSLSVMKRWLYFEDWIRRNCAVPLFTVNDPRNLFEDRYDLACLFSIAKAFFETRAQQRVRDFGYGFSVRLYNSEDGLYLAPQDFVAETLSLSKAVYLQISTSGKELPENASYDLRDEKLLQIWISLRFWSKFSWCLPFSLPGRKGSGERSTETILGVPVELVESKPIPIHYKEGKSDFFLFDGKGFGRWRFAYLVKSSGNKCLRLSYAPFERKVIMSAKSDQTFLNFF
jgi:hypothetical protein